MIQMEHYNLLEVSDHMLIDKIEDRDIFNEKSVIIDCGACVGNFTQPLFDKYKCDFYLYEPDPRNYRQLRYRFSTYKNVHLERAAIGTKIGKKKFYTGRFPTASSVFDSHRGLNGDEIYVDEINLNIELKNLSFIDLLKLDIEGAEIDVIPNLNNHLLEKIGQIIVEFHPQSEIDEYTQEKIDICRDHLKKQFDEIMYVDKGNDGHHGLYLNKKYGIKKEINF